MRIHKKQLQGKNRYIVVGDVHGCIDELEHLLRKCEYQNDTDVLIFVGDLIGKGPESLEVLKLAQEEQAFVVMGNHDLSFLRLSFDRRVNACSDTGCLGARLLYRLS